MTENNFKYFFTNRSFNMYALKAVRVGYHWPGGYTYRAEACLEIMSMTDWSLNANTQHDQRYADNLSIMM